MIQLITSILKLLFELFKMKVRRDDEAKKRKGELSREANEALKSRDVSRINAAIGRMRNV